jgi:hypothetical protein
VSVGPAALSHDKNSKKEHDRTETSDGTPGMSPIPGQRRPDASVGADFPEAPFRAPTFEETVMSISRRVFLLPRPVVSAAFAALAATSALTAALPAQAMSFQFDGEAVRANSGRALIPCIKFALNAMASPRGLEQLFSTDDAGRPVITAQNAGNTYFTMYLGVEDEGTGEPLRILPPGPCRRAECMNRDYINLLAIAADGTPVQVRATISSPDGRLDPASIFSFNPQPEPPGDFPAPMRVDFRVLTDSPSADVSVTLEVIGGNTPVTLD